MEARKFTCMAAATFVGSLLILTTVAPAHSQPPVVVHGHQYFDPEIQRRVPYGDLNLADVSGQKHLIRRVGFAVRDLCGVYMTGRADPVDRECTAFAWASANPQITTAFDQARSGAYAAAAAVTITSPR